jgi:hypothetical protein
VGTDGHDRAVWGDEVNGWFSRINAQTGQVASGAGEIFVDGRSLGFGHLFDWFDAQTLLVKGAGDFPTLINIHTGERDILSDRTADQAAAGGGVWLPAWDGRIWCAVSRTGERAWIEERGGSNDDRSLFVDGLPIVQFQPINYCRIDAGYVTWSFFARGKREVWGKRPGHGPERLDVYSGDSLFAVPVLTSLGPFVVVQSHTALHVAPWGESRGTLIATGNDKNFHPDAAWTPQGLLVVWNDDRGEQGRQFIDLTRRDTLELGVVPSKPLPIPPVITPEPETSMQYPSAEWEVVRQMHARFSSTFPATEDGGRGFTEMVVEQLDFSFPDGGWCWKKSSPNNPPSKDCTARQIDGRFEGWDILNAAGVQGPRELAENPAYHDLRGQVPIEVTAKNHLGASVPEQPAPGTHAYDGGDNDTGTCDRCGATRDAAVHQVTAPPSQPPTTPPAAGCNCAGEVAKVRQDITELTDMLLMLPANLAGLVEQIMDEKLSELPAPKPLTSFPHYQGKFFGAPISLAPVFPEKKKEQ